MRKAQVRVNVTRHHRAPGKVYGVKVELAAKDLPMTLLIALRNMPLQWRVWWDGPYGIERPKMRVLWGWLPTDRWTQGYAYARHEKGGATRVKWTMSRTAIRVHTKEDFIPVGRWGGELTVEPDEINPVQVALDVRPLCYIPKERPAPRRFLPVPDPSSPLMPMVLP